MSEPRPYDLGVHDVIAAHAVRSPDRTAIVASDGRLTYAELDRAARAVAHHLRTLADEGAVVVVDLPPSARRAAVLLGALQAGLVYSVADPDWPPVVRRDIASRLEARLTVTDTGAAGSTWSPPELGALVHAPPVGSAFVPGGGDRAACVYFTSGTTGLPKAILCPHRAVMHAFVPTPVIGFRGGQVVIQVAPGHWDMGAFELWGALLTCGTALILDDPYLTPDRLAHLVEAGGATSAGLVTSLFNILVEEDVTCLRGLRYVQVGGERVSVPHLRRAMEAVPDLRLIHAYGPSENGCVSAYHPIRAADLDDSSGLPIGTPLPGVSAWVVDEAGEACPPGTPGELYLGGVALTSGYVGLPEENRSRFPTVRIGGAVQRVYRTGDRFAQDGDGTLHFLGRIDRQTKIRGVRVELDGVEAALRRITGVRSAAVIPLRDSSGVAVGLAAHVVAPGTTADDLRRAARGALPASHVPTVFRLLPALPVTPHGKVNYAALADATPTP